MANSMSKWLPRIGFIALHVFQYLVSAGTAGGLTIASIVAALMLGAQLLPREHFKRTFRANPTRVSQFGSIAWLLISMIEMGAQGPA
jgi:hypothetical protein